MPEILRQKLCRELAQNTRLEGRSHPTAAIFKDYLYINTEKFI